MDFGFVAPVAPVAEAFRQESLQSIQGSIRQGGRDDTALRCPFRGGKVDVLLQLHFPSSLEF